MRPLQLRLKLLVDVMPDTTREPLVLTIPFQAPEALHAEAFLLRQVRLTGSPGWIALRFATRFTDTTGVDFETRGLADGPPAGDDEEAHPLPVMDTASRTNAQVRLLDDRERFLLKVSRTF